MLRSVRRPTTLEVGEQALTDGRVLRRTFPEPAGVLRAVGADPQRDDHTVHADVDTVEQETDQIQLVEGRRLPRGQLRGGLGDKPAADGTLTHAAAGDVGRERLQTPGIAAGAHADQPLLDGAPPQWIGLGHRLEGRERHLLAPRVDPGGGGSIPSAPRGRQYWTPSRPATPCGRRAARRSPSDPPRAWRPGPAIPTAPQGRTVPLRCQLATRRVATDAWSEIQHRRSDGLCETSSWRLLCCEACRLGLPTTRVSRAVRSRRFNFQQSVGHPRATSHLPF